MIGTNEIERYQARLNEVDMIIGDCIVAIEVKSKTWITEDETITSTTLMYDEEEIATQALGGPRRRPRRAAQPARGTSSQTPANHPA